MIKHICPGTIILYHILFKKSRAIHGFFLFSSFFFDYKKVIFFNFSLDKQITFCYNRIDTLFFSVPLKKKENALLGVLDLRKLLVRGHKQLAHLIQLCVIGVFLANFAKLDNDFVLITVNMNHTVNQLFAILTHCFYFLSFL